MAGPVLVELLAFEEDKGAINPTTCNFIILIIYDLKQSRSPKDAAAYEAAVIAYTKAGPAKAEVEAAEEDKGAFQPSDDGA